MQNREPGVDQHRARRPANPAGGCAGGRIRCAAALGVLFLSGLVLSPAAAQEMDNLFTNPPSLPQVAPSQEAATTPGVPRGRSALSLATTPEPHAGRERAFDLNIDYKSGMLYDPSQQRYQKVSLRGYIGTGVTSDAFVAPQIDVTPGDTVRITLHNKLKEARAATAIPRRTSRIATTAPTCIRTACGSARPAIATTCCCR